MNGEKPKSESRQCGYPQGCGREGVRLFNAPPVNGWLCEEHFREILDAVAEVDAAARKKRDDAWFLFFERYLRERNLAPEAITKADAQAAIDLWKFSTDNPDHRPADG